MSAAGLVEIDMKLTFAALAFLLAAAAAACNTVEGVGQDTQAVGEAVEDAADDAKN
jgi:entericidin B